MVQFDGESWVAVLKSKPWIPVLFHWWCSLVDVMRHQLLPVDHDQDQGSLYSGLMKVVAASV